MIKMMKGNRKNGRSTFQILSLFSPGAQVIDMLHSLFCSCLTFSFIYAASLFLLIGLMSAISGSSFSKSLLTHLHLDRFFWHLS